MAQATRTLQAVLDNIEEALSGIANAASERSRLPLQTRLRELYRELVALPDAPRDPDIIKREIERTTAAIRTAETIFVVNAYEARLKRLYAELTMALGRPEKLRSVLGL